MDFLPERNIIYFETNVISEAKRKWTVFNFELIFFLSVPIQKLEGYIYIYVETIGEKWICWNKYERYFGEYFVRYNNSFQWRLEWLRMEGYREYLN